MTTNTDRGHDGPQNATPLATRTESAHRPDASSDADAGDRRPADRPSDAASILRELRRLVREHYVLAEQAGQIAEGLGSVPLDGCPPDEAARRLSQRLLEAGGDLHLRVRYRPDGAASGFDDAAYEAQYAAEAVHNAGGIACVRRLDEWTGLLTIAPYTSPVDMAEPYVAAAFGLLAGVRRLVVDLRDGRRGGTPETVALICGYLLGREPVHLQDLVERDGTTRQYWTSPAAGRIDAGVPICVLTGAGTFSGCEELGYDLQALGRATLVGETTAGGAHPVEAFRLTDVLEARIPVARSVNAVTGTNWERVGVVPDIACPAADALDVALAHLATTPQPPPS